MPGAQRGDRDRRELTPTIPAAGPSHPIPPPQFWAQTQGVACKAAAKTRLCHPPGRDTPVRPPEDPTLCQRTQEGDTRDTGGGTQNGEGVAGSSCPAPPASRRAPGARAQGTPSSRGQWGPPAQPHGLTQPAGRRRQEQEEQRDHGAGAWVPRAGVRAAGHRIPTGIPTGPACGCQPPTFLRRPQTGRARSPGERLLRPSARQRGVLRTAALVARVGSSPHPGSGAAGATPPGAMPSSGSPRNPAVPACVPPRHRVPPSRDPGWFWGCPHPPTLHG